MTFNASLLYEICQRVEDSDFKDSSDFQLCIDAIKSNDTLAKKLAIQFTFRYESWSSWDFLQHVGTAAIM